MLTISRGEAKILQKTCSKEDAMPRGYRRPPVTESERCLAQEEPEYETRAGRGCHRARAQSVHLILPGVRVEDLLVVHPVNERQLIV